MNQFQKLNFKSIDEFMDFLPMHEKRIVHHLRSLILDNCPSLTEKLSYNVPYYWQHTRVCFIWPSSVPWGKVVREGVLLGFPNGNLMRDELQYLDVENRKQVRTRTFMDLHEIEDDLVKTFLFEALEVDKRIKMKNS